MLQKEIEDHYKEVLLWVMLYRSKVETHFEDMFNKIRNAEIKVQEPQEMSTSHGMPDSEDAVKIKVNEKGKSGDCQFYECDVDTGESVSLEVVQNVELRDVHISNDTSSNVCRSSDQQLGVKCATHLSPPPLYPQNQDSPIGQKVCDSVQQHNVVQCDDLNLHITTSGCAQDTDISPLPMTYHALGEAGQQATCQPVMCENSGDDVLQTRGAPEI